MASQTFQDVKAIYAAAKAKLDSLPAKRNQEVQIFLMQRILACFVALMVAFTILGVQIYFFREEARQLQREADEMRWQHEQRELRLHDATRSK